MDITDRLIMNRIEGKPERAIDPNMLQTALGCLAEMIEYASRSGARDRFPLMFRLAKIAHALEREGAEGVEDFADEDDDYPGRFDGPLRIRRRRRLLLNDAVGPGLGEVDIVRNAVMMFEGMAAPLTAYNRARELNQLETLRVALKRRKGDTASIDRRIAALLEQINAAPETPPSPTPTSASPTPFQNTQWGPNADPHPLNPG
jgi:hypothetical protein